MRKIAITGNIGSGKSLCSEWIRQLGYSVFDCDEAARLVLDPGQEGYADTIAAFGPEIITPVGTIDRSRLSALVFSDEDKRRQLEVIVHPAVFRRMDTAINQCRQPLFFAEVPLLFEVQAQHRFDEIILLVVEPEILIRRLAATRQMPEDAVRQRLAAQADHRQVRSQATLVLENNGDRNALRQQLTVWVRNLEENKWN